MTPTNLQREKKVVRVYESSPRWLTHRRPGLRGVVETLILNWRLKRAWKKLENL